MCGFSGIVKQLLEIEHKRPKKNLTSRSQTVCDFPSVAKELNLVLPKSTLVSRAFLYFLTELIMFSPSFWAFRGLSYGMSGPMAHLPDSTAAVYKWMDSWEV